MTDVVEERRKVESQASRKALDGVLEERDYQRSRWNQDKERSMQDWSGILGTWMGKIHAATYSSDGAPVSKEAFKKRVTQLGAICLAVLESVPEE